jgi:hypothetical protein
MERRYYLSIAAISLAGCTSTDDSGDSGNTDSTESSSNSDGNRNTDETTGGSESSESADTTETSNQVESVPAADGWQGPEMDTSEFHYLIENETNNVVNATLVSIANQNNADEYLPDDMEEALLVVFDQTRDSDALTRLDVSNVYVVWEQSHNGIPLLGYALDNSGEGYEYGWVVDYTTADQVQSGSIGEDEFRQTIEGSVRYYD